jgi:hypothetical protein
MFWLGLIIGVASGGWAGLQFGGRRAIRTITRKSHEDLLRRAGLTD